MDDATPQQRRNRLLAAIDPDQHFHRLFDHLPGIYFFVKDPDGRILLANRELAQLYGFEDPVDFVGRTDFDVLPRRLAEKFRADDTYVMETGQPLLDMVELFMSPDGVPDWFKTSKMALRSSAGEVIGLMGIIQPYRGSVKGPDHRLGLEQVAGEMRERFSEPLPISQFIESSGLSRRQFENEFRAAYGTTPHQFRIRIRVTKACELLRKTRISVSDVATQSGFYDQSALSRHLKLLTGYTPLAYRKRFS